MGILSTDFCGLKLNNPLIIASCPASESVAGLVKCNQSGAGAVILKSMANYDEDSFLLIPRRVHLDSRGLWATSSFRREVFPRKKGMGILKEAKQQIAIPLIVSIAGLTLDLDDWLPICQEAEELGADMLQLDLFYLPQPITSQEHFAKLTQLVDQIGKNIKIPVIPKINIELPAYLIADSFPQLSIAGLSLVDSVRVNSPINVLKKGASNYLHIRQLGMSSVLGSWQLPITQHYTYLLSKHTRLSICAGGGLTSAQDAVEMLMLGATTIQFATAVILKGYGYIQQLLDDMVKIITDLGFQSITQLQGLAIKDMNTDIEECRTVYDSVVAEIDAAKCTACKRCSKLAFCDAIGFHENRIQLTQSLCDGCGLCVAICEGKAIYLKNTMHV